MHVTAYARFFSPFCWFSTSLKEVNVFLYNIYCRPNRTSSVGKESACNAGDPISIPALGRSPGEGKGYPLQYSGLENSMDCIVHGVAKSRTRQSDFQFFKQEKKWKTNFWFWEMASLIGLNWRWWKSRFPLSYLSRVCLFRVFVSVSWGWNFIFLFDIFSFSTLYCQRINYKPFVDSPEDLFFPIRWASGLPRWFCANESTYQAGNKGLIPVLGSSLGEGYGNPLQYSCLRNPVDRGAWQAAVHGVQGEGQDLASKQQQ